MSVTLHINGRDEEIHAAGQDNLRDALRNAGYVSVRFGSHSGETGAAAVLLDGRLVSADTLLVGQAVGHRLDTIEGLDAPVGSLHPLQQAFIETGAIQSGYSTPAMILAAKALLDRNPHPTESEVREALSGVLCRETGYLRPVQAVLRAAAILRGEQPPSFHPEVVDVGYLVTVFPNDDDGTLGDGGDLEVPEPPDRPGEGLFGTRTETQTHTAIILHSGATPETNVVGKSETKVDAVKLAKGNPAFVDDIEMRGMLYARLLTSPHAHAHIIDIDDSEARALPGVRAVIHYKNIERVKYASGGQSYPNPPPHDQVSFDNKVRYVGDRVAAVAADTLEIAEAALKLIHVEYDVLPAVFGEREAILPGAPVIHDETDTEGIRDATHNIVHHIQAEKGNVNEGFAQADHVFEHSYYVHQVQQVPIEPHIAISWWDADERLVIRTSTQVPFHVRRMLAPVLNIPVKRIRVIKPRIGGGFGGKQEVLMEDVPAHLTIATKRPVIYEYSREEEFIAARSRHPMRVRMKTGVKKDGTITANSMYALSDTGAYGCHALTVTGNTGHKSMALYVGDGEYRKSPNIRFYADVVYTNTPPAGAFRGYGVPQGYWPLDRHLEKIARAMGFDPIEFRLKNAIHPGEYHPFSTAWNEGREPRPEIIHTVGLEQCVAQGRAAIAWDDKFGNENWKKTVSPTKRKGIGVAMVMQGTAIPYLDMGGASIKMNDDGSFNLLVGATDLGTGSDTVIAQMAAEVLGVPLEDMITYSSDTDFTPFDKGAYASSTTYISGTAAVKAANIVAERIKIRAATMLELPDSEYSNIRLADRKAIAPDGRSVTLADIALDTLHKNNQEQIMGVASYVSPVSPPPFAAGSQ